jgi:hypothetical protein
MTSQESGDVCVSVSLPLSLTGRWLGFQVQPSHYSPTLSTQAYLGTWTAMKQGKPCWVDPKSDVPHRPLIYLASFKKILITFRILRNKLQAQQATAERDCITGWHGTHVCCLSALPSEVAAPVCTGPSPHLSSSLWSQWFPLACLPWPGQKEMGIMKGSPGIPVQVQKNQWGHFSLMQGLTLVYVSSVVIFLCTLSAREEVSIDTIDL